jgi:hypothetical protein
LGWQCQLISPRHSPHHPIARSPNSPTGPPLIGVHLSPTVGDVPVVLDVARLIGGGDSLRLRADAGHRRR